MLTGGNVGLGSITDFDVAIRTEKTEMLVLLKDRQLWCSVVLQRSDLTSIYVIPSYIVVYLVSLDSQKNKPLVNIIHVNIGKQTVKWGIREYEK